MKIVKKYGRLVTNLRNSEHYGFNEYVNNFVKAALSGVQGIQPMWSAYNILFEKEDVVFKRSAASVETKYINEINHERHSVFMMFRGKVTSSMISFDDTEKDAAVKLNELLHNYKAISTASMAEVSALVTNMMQDIKQSRYDDAVEELKLSAVVCKLACVNEKFKEIYKERFLSLEASEVLGSMHSIRVQVDKALRLLTQSIDIAYAAAKLSSKNDVAAAGKLIDDINSVIDQYERILAHRGSSSSSTGKGDNDGDDDDEDMPEPAAPSFAVTSQTIEGDFTMVLIIGDQPVFEAVLYPIAAGGNIVLTSDEVNDSYNEFPISSFEIIDNKPVGLLVYPPDDSLNFYRPMVSMGECHAEIYKDDELLATLTGLEWPASYGGHRAQADNQPPVDEVIA